MYLISESASNYGLILYYVMFQCSCRMLLATSILKCYREGVNLPYLGGKNWDLISRVVLCYDYAFINSLPFVCLVLKCF